MAESNNTDLIKSLYAAFYRGDIPGLLEICAPDVDWEYPMLKEAPQVPFSGRRHGRDDVRRYFEAVPIAEEVLEFQQHDNVAQGDRVLVLGTSRGKARSTGRIWETRFVHAFTIRAGKVQTFEAYFDTAAAVEAYREPIGQQRAGAVVG
jgi:ketosteroid isomerase-like protein